MRHLADKLPASKSARTDRLQNIDGAVNLFCSCNSMRKSLERALSGLTSDVSADAGYDAGGYDAGGYGRRRSFAARPSADFGQSSVYGAGGGRRSGAFDGAASSGAYWREASFERRTSFHSSFHSSYRFVCAALAVSAPCGASCVLAVHQSSTCAGTTFTTLVYLCWLKL